MLKTELVAGKAAPVRFHAFRPLATGSLVPHVARSCMIVHPDFFAEPPAEQGRCGNAEDLARGIPQGHLDAADGAHQRVRRPVGPSPHPGVEGIDFKWILTYKILLLELVDAFLDSNTGAAVCLTDTVRSCVGFNLHQRIVPIRALE